MELCRVFQVTSEQLMLVQANFVDQENQWKEDRQRLEVKVKDTVEKHEHELSEKELQVQTLRTSLTELESAYSQAASQYNALQVGVSVQRSAGGRLSTTLCRCVKRSAGVSQYSPSEMFCPHEKYLHKIGQYIFHQMKARKLFRTQSANFILQYLTVYIWRFGLGIRANFKITCQNAPQVSVSVQRSAGRRLGTMLCRRVSQYNALQVGVSVQRSAGGCLGTTLCR